jgi:hypothetical protein
MCTSATPFFESRYSEVTIKAPDQMPFHVKVEIIHYDEMNDKIFDTDMSVWDNARNVIESISFHRFHGPDNSTIYI